jgi:hypothetical protein
MISDSAATKVKGSGSLLARLSSSALLPGWATNAWVVGTSANDVSTLSSLGGVVWVMGTTADVLSPEMVRTYARFWPWWLLRMRWPLRIHRPRVSWWLLTLCLTAWGQPDGGLGCHLHGAHCKEQVAHHHVLHHRGAR